MMGWVTSAGVAPPSLRPMSARCSGGRVVFRVRPCSTVAATVTSPPRTSRLSMMSLRSSAFAAGAGDEGDDGAADDCGCGDGGELLDGVGLAPVPVLDFADAEPPAY